MNTINNILLRHNYIDIPKFVGTSEVSQVGPDTLATITMNLSHYGKALSVEAYKMLTKMTVKGVVAWWRDTEMELKSITGDDRKIGDFVVYKNFPKEVLDKTEAEYWLPQILMYWGFPKEFFTQPVEPRKKMDKQPKCVVLKLAKATTTKDIFNSLLKAPARWKAEEFQDVLLLSDVLPINLAKLAFKENLVKLATDMMGKGKAIKINTATDVLRLAAGLSDGDVALREKFKFKSFKKSERKYLLSMLETCTNLSEDVARRAELFKRLMHQLHPFDFKKRNPRVCQVANDLYRDRLETFNSKVEVGLINKDTNVLDLLASRPGDFRRRLVHTLDVFGTKAVKAFVADEVLEKLTTAQIVSMRTYLETVNDRVYRTFPPKGNWTKVHVAAARHVDEKQVKAISKALGKVLEARLPKVKLDIETINIKLPSNDGEVSPYNRGTVFPIPKEVDFIRTASYWQSGRAGTVWFDNGWNFFDHNWKNMGACCWTSVSFPNSSTFFSQKKMVDAAAIFSGDPINTGEMQGRAAQLIDLYPSKLMKAGVRYAVWNILCYSNIPFSQVEDVFAALQWGTDPQQGKLFEPSRCQLSFPLKGESKTKYIALIDLYSRDMVYLDANLRGNVSDANRNGKYLKGVMPAYMEYIKSLPSVHDLFRESEDKKSVTHILYSDKDVELNGQPAYIFKPENQKNKYKVVDINSLLTE